MSFPRWLSWIVLIGLAYILYVGNTRSDDAPAPRVEGATTVADVPSQEYKEIRTLLDGERWVRALNPDYDAALSACSAGKAEGTLPGYALVTREGEGEGVKCGDTIQVAIARIGNDGRANKAKEMTLKLGEQKNLDALLLGMKIGEERVLLVNLPKQHANLPANTQLLLNVTRAPTPAPAE